MNDRTQEFFAHSLVMRGGDRRKATGACQDEAVARSSSAAGAVLVVCDGVSLVGGQRSRTEIGAYLGAHLASRAALEMLVRGDADGDVKGAIGRALYHGLRGLWTELPSEAADQAFCSTMIVAVVTHRSTRIWISGDGAYGIIAPPSTRIVQGSVDPRTRWRATSPAGVYSIRGSLETRRMAENAISESRRSPEAAAGRLTLALSADGPVFGAWIASDGLEDEVAAGEVLELPLRSSGTLRSRLRRAGDADDLAVAWAAERMPGFFGLGHVPSYPEEVEEVANG